MRNGSYTSTFKDGLLLLGKIILVLVLVVVINQLIYLAINPEYSWGSDKIHRKRMFLKPVAGMYNTMFLGDSKIGQSIIPQEFDSIVNQNHPGEVSSFNFGIGSLSPPESYFLLEQLLSSDSIKLKYVIIQLYDISIIGPRLIHTRRSIYWYTFAYYWFTVKSLIFSKDELPRRLKALKNHTISYMEKILNMGFLADYSNFLAEEKNLDFNIKKEGYFSMEFSTDPETVKKREEFLADSSNLINMREISLKQNYEQTQNAGSNIAHLEKINKLIKICNAKGTKLIFLLSPNMGKKNNVVIQLFNNIDPAHRIELSDAKKFPELYRLGNSFDGKHFNLNGARLFTKLLAQKFTELDAGKVRSEK